MRKIFVLFSVLCITRALAQSPENATEVSSVQKLSEDKEYGFTTDKPIKTGMDPSGGVTSQKAYLEQLQDSWGNPVKYERIGCCCPHSSIHSPFGTAMLDKYEITYMDEKAKVRTSTIYITCYDYEAPKILFGFKSAVRN